MRWASILSTALLVAGASAVPHVGKHRRISSASAADSDPAYWLADIKHQGLAPAAASGYKVFRNVMDYGATGK